MIALALFHCMLLHPFHVSVGQAQWNPQSERFEISLRLDPTDLHNALSRHAGKPIDLEAEDSSQLREPLMSYVRKRFVVTDAHQRAATWHWVGIENEVKHLWLHLELQPDRQSEQLILTNTLLHEVAPSQSSTILLGTGKQRSTLRFSRSHPSQRLIRSDDLWSADTSDRPANPGDAPRDRSN